MLKGGMRGWKAAGLATTRTAAKPSDDRGMLLYATQCATCHQSEGAGLPGHFPPLAGDGAVNQQDPTALTGIILYGGQGGVIEGRSYSGVMPAFAGSLTDEEIAAVETYVRSHWGNHVPAVAPAHVAKVRGVKKQGKPLFGDPNAR